MAELFRLALTDEVPEDAWRTRLQWTSAYKGVPGLDDTFIHLSTAEQVVDTAAAYFAGNTGLVLLRFSAESMQTEADLKIKWGPAAPPPGEAKRSGGDFPHVYGGAIPYACLSAPPALLTLDADGKHAFPPLGPVLTAAEIDLREMLDSGEAVERGMDDEDGYDGGAARGMWG